jgi:hypothetical protein
MRSVEESVPRERRPGARRLTFAQAVAVLAVIAAVVGTFVWLLFFSSGGFGFGST